MNNFLENIFKLQKEFDKYIEKKFPEIKSLSQEDNFEWKLLAFKVELGELANEWRGFKMWSLTQTPTSRVTHLCPICEGRGHDSSNGINGIAIEDCHECKGEGILGVSYPLLEEFVDCIHMLASIGLDLDLDINPDVIDTDYQYLSDDNEEINKHHTISLFNDIFHLAESLYYTQVSAFIPDPVQVRFRYEEIIAHLFHLGFEHLGFSSEEVWNAFVEKNNTNYKRQKEGY